MPSTAWIVLLVTFLNVAIWTVVIPPFQVPDETDHFAYAQYLAETGSPPPQGPRAQFSPQEDVALNSLFFFSVIGHPSARGVGTLAEQMQLRSSLAAHPSAKGPGGASSVTNQPPLYYAFMAIAYRLSPLTDILARLEVMRLISALMAGFATLAIFLFLREIFPANPWAWSVGSLAVGFQPEFAFISAGVHSDSLLFLASALTFLVLARSFADGLTPRRGALIGVIVAVGLLSKLTYVSLIPGVILALVVIAWRAHPGKRCSAWLSAGLATVVASVPVAAYGLLNATVWHRGGPTAGGFAGAATASLPGNRVVTLRQTLDYIWELYLPRLPFMNHRYFSYLPLRDTFFKGTVGEFGWLDYGFPPRVYSVASYVFLVLAAMAAVGLWNLRAEFSKLLPLFLAFAIMALGLLAAIGYAGIRYLTATGYRFEQARYLFPLLSIYALCVVLAAHGAPRRWSPAAGAALVVLAMAHGLFAELLTISRYYG